MMVSVFWFFRVTITSLTCIGVRQTECSSVLRGHGRPWYSEGRLKRTEVVPDQYNQQPTELT